MRLNFQPIDGLSLKKKKEAKPVCERTASIEPRQEALCILRDSWFPFEVWLVFKPRENYANQGTGDMWAITMQIAIKKQSMQLTCATL